MLELRDYQTRAVEHVESLNFEGQMRLCLESPTGSGKSVMMAALLKGYRRQWVITHRRVLLDQLAGILDSMGIEYGRIAAGHDTQLDKRIQLCMWQTLHRRRKLLNSEVDRTHIDEIHCMRGDKCNEVFDSLYSRGASLIGYTATPSDLGGMVDDVYRVATIPQLIKQGYLCPPRVFSCTQPDVKLIEQLKRDAQGEYTAGSVDKIMKPNVIFGHVLENYGRLNPDGRPFVLFAHSVKASLWWAQSLTAKGLPTAHIDGNDVWVDGQFYESDTEKRQMVFDMINDGRIKGLSNRFVLREGWDCPIVGHAILTCPFGLRKTYVQACGRVLRPHPSRDYTIIQDHTGSCISHPALDSDEPWDWQEKPGLSERVRVSKMRNDEIPEPISCPECNALRYAGATCPYCGFKYPKRSRYVVQTNGHLRLVEGRMYRPRPVKPKKGDQKVWDRLYWSTVKNGNRTAEQAYCYYAYQNNWRWLPRDLYRMPIDEADWFIPLRDVPDSRLRLPRKSFA